VISFDFDGTLVTHSFADAFWLEGVPSVYAQQHHMTVHAAKQYLLEEYDKIGDNRIEWYDPTYWFTRFQLNSNWNDLLEHYRPAVELYPEAATVLKQLSKHYTLIISSNAKREFITIQLDQTHLNNYFTHVFSSTSDFHTVKKVTDFYAMICTRLHIQPTEIVHVGDHKEFDYTEPQHYGITSFYLDRNKTNTGPFIVHDLNEFKEKITNLSTTHKKELKRITHTQ
jgi:putative hydrolase of the HAD superfamily